MAVKDFFDNLNGGARWDVGVSINRSNSLPLDANSVFASLEAAQNYAAGNPAEGTLANAYPGQVLAVVTDAETIIYYIDANMALQPVGNTKDVMAYIGEIPEGADAKTIIEYINKKTEGIATDAALAELQAAVAKKVDAVEGKGLSTNDLTDDLKANYDAAYEHSQVAHAPADAQANLIEKIKVNGAEQTITDKAVDITVPTKVSDLDNDEGYLTEHQDISGKADKATTLEGYGITDAYTTTEVDTAVQGAKDYAKGLVDALPEQTDYSVSIEEDTTDSTIAKRYIFKQLGEEIGRIDLAKELVVQSGSVGEVAEAGKPYEGAVVGDKYIELVIANQEAPIYIPAKDLVDIYTAQANATEVQVAISNTNEISATLVNGGIAEEKLAEAVKTKLNKAHDHENKTILDGITEEVVRGWNIAAGAQHSHSNYDLLQTIDATKVEAWDAAEQNAKDYADELNSAMDERVGDLEKIEHHDHANKTLLDGITDAKVAAWDAAERNVIASVDTAQFAIVTDEEKGIDRQLTLLDIAQSKISGLTNADGESITLQDALDGIRDHLLDATGSVDSIGKQVVTIENKLNGIEAGAQVNDIEAIKIAGMENALPITDKVVEIPLATLENPGVIKLSAEVGVDENNALEVKSINVNKLVQDEGSYLILNGGGAAL